MPRDPEEGSEVRTSERNSRVGVLGYLPIAISCTGDETLDQGRSMIKLSSGPESCTYLRDHLRCGKFSAGVRRTSVYLPDTYQ